MNSNLELIQRLQDRLRETLSAIVPALDDYALLDFPNHSNVGDSAIYLGELVLLERLYGKRSAFVAEMSSEGLARTLPARPGHAIFLHGGGNFGDIWPHHQLFRESVIEQFPDHRIVQLPQTLHFGDQAALRRTADIIGRHRDFTLLVRDGDSLRIAKENFACPVHLCPDSAFMLGPLAPRREAAGEALFLLRTDKEAGALEREALRQRLPDARIEDWLGEPPVKSRRQRREDRLRKRFPAVEGLLRRRREADYRGWAEQRVERGLRQLSSAPVVVTDRLHGHILSLLLDKPHILLDNSYGKVSTFVRAWTEGGNFRQAASLDEAARLAGLASAGAAAAA